MSNIDRRTLTIVHIPAPENKTEGPEQSARTANSKAASGPPESRLPPAAHFQRRSRHSDLAVLDRLQWMYNKKTPVPPRFSDIATAILKNDHRAVAAIADELKLSSNSLTPAQTMPLLEHAIGTKKSTEVEQALLNLPGVRPTELLTAAMKAGNGRVARRLLQLGVDPRKIDKADIDGATPGMRRFLRSAKVISKLYPPRTRTPDSDKESVLSQALINYDLKAARDLLTREMEREKLTEVGLWRKYAKDGERTDLKCAILALADQGVVDKLAEPTTGAGTRTSIMHTDMHALKDTHPKLLAHLKSFPYRSEKHGDVVQLNMDAHFAGTEIPIMCRHLSTKWLAQRMRNQNKSDYQVFQSIKALEDESNFSLDLEKTYQQLVCHDVERHLKRNDEWGEMVIGLFHKMANIPSEENEKERALHLLVETTNHSMGAELKIKNKPDGTKSYVVHFYDGNYTAGDKRIAVDDLDELRTLDLCDMLPRKDYIDTYCGTRREDKIFTAHVLSSDALDKPLPEVMPEKTLTSCSDVLGEKFLFSLLSRDYAEDMKRILPALTDHLSALSEPEQVEILNALSQEDSPGLYWAMQNGYGKVAAVFCEYVLKSDLPESTKCQLIDAKSPKRNTALGIAMLLDNAEAVGVFCDAILTSGLSDTAKVALLTKPNRDRVCPLYVALQRGNHKSVEAFCDSVLKSTLVDADKVAILSALNASGVRGFMAAMKDRKTESVKSFCDSVLRSELPPQQIVTLLSGNQEETASALATVLELGDADMVSTFCELVLDSDLPNEQKRDLLKAPDAFGFSGVFTAAENGHTEAITVYLRHIITSTSLSNDDKLALLTVEDAAGATLLQGALEFDRTQLVELIGTALNQPGLSPAIILKVFCAIGEDGISALLDIDPPPYEETVDAYSRMAESLGIRDQAIVKEILAF